MRRSTLTKLGVIVLVLLLFVGYTVYLKWDRSHFAVDSEAFDVKDSFDEVMDEDIEQIDGLRLVDDFDKTDHVDITRDFPNKQRDLKIHDVWLTSNQFYVLYSVNLKKEDQAPADIPELNFSDVTLNTDNHDTITVPLTQDDRQSEEHDAMGEADKLDESDEGVVFDKRLYRSLVMEPDYEELVEDDMLNAGDLYTDTTHITLEGASLGMDDDEQPIEDLVVESAYNEDDQTLFTMPLDEEVQLENGRTLTFQELSVAPFANTLYFSAEKNGLTMQGIEADFTWDRGGSSVTEHHVIEEDGLSTAFMPFEVVPEQLGIDLKSVTYNNDEDVSFHVPADPEQKDVSDKVGEAKGTTFYFEGYESSDFADDPRRALKLRWDLDEDTENNDFFNPILDHDLKMKYEEIEDEELQKDMIDLHADILTIENEKGDRPEFKYSKDTGKMNLLRTEDTTAIYLDWSFVEEAEDIHITIEKLSFSEDVEGGGTFQIDIPDEYVSDE